MPRSSLHDAGGAHAVHRRRQQRGAVDHRGIDHLAVTRARGLEDAADDPEREQHAAAAEIADEVQGRDAVARPPARSPKCPASEM